MSWDYEVYVFLTKYSWFTYISEEYDLIQMEDLSLSYDCQEYEKF